MEPNDPVLEEIVKVQVFQRMREEFVEHGTELASFQPDVLHGHAVKTRMAQESNHVYGVGSDAFQSTSIERR